MCLGKTFGGQTVLVKEYPDDSFVDYLDEDNDGCFDEMGEGFYMLGTSKRTQVWDLEKGKYCLK
jgi:hypothetical protein